MANQEQEINQQSETTNQATESLEVNTPEDTNTTPETTVEGQETTPEQAESSTTPTAESQSETGVDSAPITEPTATATPEDAAANQEETPSDSASVDETPVIETPVAELADEPVAETTENLVDPEQLPAEYTDLAEAEEEATAPEADYSHFSKQDFVNLLETQLASVSLATVTPGDFKKADQVLKEVKPLFDQMKRAEREAALQAYTAETGADEGFEYKFDDAVLRFEELYKQIKSLKNTYFQNLDKAKETNFASKTDLLTRLRELVENDENNAGDPKASWNEFKKIQDEWKAAGNMNSPHNATLWATYHALVDRYYSNRNIYFELKELDRKRNTSLKTEVIEKVEAMAKASEETPVTRQTIDEANALFEEYKHIGPAPKAEQEVLWGRMKAALDVLYDKRRDQTNEQRKESAQLYEEKSAIYEELVPITSFTSNSINDWNDKTKVVMTLQDRWNAIKGPMPREEGKELSKKFWAALKTFFHNKGEFFRQLESKREENLRAKTQLCEQVEAILASGEESPEITQTVIELQRQWKAIGQVPEKQKNTIFDRFKAACDAFFNKKRSKNQETEREFEENLAQKIALIERIEAAASANADLSELNEFKKEWNAIGFVPKKDMQATQKRYINAINALVGATGKIPAKDKERIMLQSEAEATRSGNTRGGRDFNRGDRDGGGNKRESDIRRKITAIENDIATYRNNIEFFARSKNADKLRADIDKKIAEAEKQLDELRHQLRVAQA
ncbi:MULTISPECIES: DUF349 domain-containing protein [unclassified Spirosoma]|uniref:DUF349 domain-containing protein n=1 Tax=unclassified Spirosoma TaxID=2621999 RepID=UPI000964BD77|nr:MULTISPECIES: DUF349 domain-containing protein [unclassified Spirosoma]MBN8825490.1 DUF349 domain-containing protein [Spirosoma sp.]OJW74256.1 MAG: hypothetical protein BGO59_14165 [Spirosoma sp. 48-14]